VHRAPRASGPRTLRRLAVELITEIRHLDRRIAAATTDISTAVADSATTLTQLRGIGDLTAGKILAGDESGRTPGGDYTVQRGRLNP
jgi:transposase